MTTVENPVHFRIYVYDNSHPLAGDPVAVALCPFPGRTAGPLVGDAGQVTCPRCRKHIDELGIDWAPVD